jgi:methyl coenzyme M reductase gamma subunit
MMKNLDKSKLNEMTQELKMQTEDVNKELDRTLELLKKMNVEEK